MLRRALMVTVSLLFAAWLSRQARADIYRWDTGEVIPGTEGITPGPGVQLDYRELQYADLTALDLAGAHFREAELANANLSESDLVEADFRYASLASANMNQVSVARASFEGATLIGADLSHGDLTDAFFGEALFTNANLTDAVVNGAYFTHTTSLTKEQIYSTASFKIRNLSGIGLAYNNLSGWDSAGQNLTRAGFIKATLTGANMSFANLANANFYQSTLTDANLSQADLSGAWFGYTTDFGPATLTNANLSGSIVGSTNLSGTIGFVPAQLYSTASYQAKDLRTIDLSDNDLAGWDFSHQDLTNSSFHDSILTNANLSGADLRGADQADLPAAITENTIKPDGSIDGLNLGPDGELRVRDYDGDSRFLDPPRPSVPIGVHQYMAIPDGTSLKLIFESDPWDSLISFEPGIPVELGGTLELSFADDVNAAMQVGRTLQIFDWTGVSPVGEFSVTSPYAWDTSRLYTTGEVTLLPTADFDGDGTVNAADLGIWQTHFGADLTREHGDADFNGLIDGADFLVWQRQLSAAESSPVPEPSTAWLAILALIPVLRVPLRMRQFVHVPVLTRVRRRLRFRGPVSPIRGEIRWQVRWCHATMPACE